MQYYTQKTEGTGTTDERMVKARAFVRRYDDVQRSKKCFWKTVKVCCNLNMNELATLKEEFIR